MAAWTDEDADRPRCEADIDDGQGVCLTRLPTWGSACPRAARHTIHAAPEQRTVWCQTCAGPSDVVDTFDDQIGHEEQARPVHVTALDCGHDEVTER